jgi:hypothetical protein
MYDIVLLCCNLYLKLTVIGPENSIEIDADNYSIYISKIHNQISVKRWERVMSEGLLCNAMWAIFQLIHGKNKLLINDINIMSALC